MSKIIFGLLTAALLTACSGKSSKNQIITGTSPDFGKPRPPIFLEYRISKTSEPGVPTTVEISGKPFVDAAKFSIALRLPAGVELVAGLPGAEAANVASGQKITSTVQVRAQRPGLYYLPLDGKITQPAETASDTISIPFQVGDAQPLAKPGAIRQSGGEKIIEMPAGK